MSSILNVFYRKKGNYDMFNFHSHTEFEIYRFHGGDCRYIIQDKIYQLEPGDILIMNGLTLHRANPTKTSTYERSVIEFSQEWIRPTLSTLNITELLDPFYKLNNYLFRGIGRSRSNKIDQLLCSLSQLVPEKTSLRSRDEHERFNEAKVLLLMTDLLFEIYEMSLSQLGKEPLLSYSKENHVGKIIQWIDQHFTENLTLDMAAQSLNLSKYYMCHLFKEQTGGTIMDYLMSCRLNRAKFLLKMHPEKSILEVGTDSGFSHSSHFSRYFFNKTGLTPSAYRKKYRKCGDRKVQAFNK